MKLYLVEVGARGFVRVSTTQLLKDLGSWGAALNKASRELSEAERVSFCLWLRMGAET